MLPFSPGISTALTPELKNFFWDLAQIMNLYSEGAIDQFAMVPHCSGYIVAA
jgi:hypothetical protein